MGLNLKKLFERNVASTQDSTPTENAYAAKSQARRTGETYQQWGTRICGIVSGSLNALPPFLQKVYNYIYNEQANNKELQEQLIKEKQTEIAQKETDLDNKQKNCDKSKKNIAELKDEIEELKNEKSEIGNSQKKVNYEHMPAFIIGLIILIPLTCYLFLFYSSSFYSAFFRNPEDMNSIANAMFDSNALSNAYNNGTTSLLFVLLAPIIFLGLGFILHVFSEQKKYIRLAGILLVTIMFDCILAFKIGDQLHTFNMMTGNAPLDSSYGMKEAVVDINTWAVIFCGFIAYVIWGVVFDFVMSAYNKMDFNRTRTKEIDTEIQKKKVEIQEEKKNIANYQSEIVKLTQAIQKLTKDIGNVVKIEYAAIKTELNNFYAGWTVQMEVLQRPAEEHSKAKEIFDKMIQSIDKQANV